MYDFSSHATAKLNPDYDPFIQEGEHSLIVLSVERYNDNKHGPSTRARFLIDSSSSMAPGTFTVKTWYDRQTLQGPSGMFVKEDGQGELVKFAFALQGIKEAAPSEIPEMLRSLCLANGGRGARIKAHGVGKMGKPKNGQPGKTYVNVRWESVPNDNATIIATRAILDAKYPYAPKAAGAPQTYAQPQAQYQQAPQGYANPAAAPVQNVPTGGFLAGIK